MTSPAGWPRTARGGVLDRALRAFSDVRAGEAPTVLLLTLNVFILLTAYYILKVVREPLVLAIGTSGAEIKSRAAAGQAVLLLLLVPVYGAIAARVPRRRLINLVTGFFVACLVAFFVLARLRVAVGVPFYVWVGIFNMMIVAQFWSFANDVYTTDEGKRLFPIVAFGASAGAVFGSWVAGPLQQGTGLYPLFLVGAGLLVAAAAVTNWVDVRERRRTEAAVPAQLSSGQLPAATSQIRAATGEFRVPGEAYRAASGEIRALARRDLERARQAAAGHAPPQPGSAFGLVLRSRYLLLIALLMLLLNWVNTNGEYVLGKTVSAAAQAAAARGGPTAEIAIGAFYSGQLTIVNLVALALQLFVVSRVIRHAGVRFALLVLPVIACSGYALMAFAPILAAVRVAKIAENATDYSLQATVRNVLFLPTTREEKYAAKQAIDAFFVRMGDVLSAGLIWIGTTAFAFGAREFALANLVLVAAWIVLAVLIGRRYARLVAVAP